MENDEVPSEQPELLGDSGTKNCIDEKLWNLCAGLLCDLPKIGEKVYYFPQGYIELIEAFTQEDLNHIMPTFKLPSKLRCRVISIQRKMEKDTDEVYAEISLMPDTVNITIPIPNGDKENERILSFSKVLTSSDANTHGGLFVPKREVLKCLPPLNVSPGIPSQELSADDLNGQNWKFKHIFRGSPVRHLFTTGWSAFTTAKRLVAGDCFILVSGESGELRVGIRRARYQQGNIHSPIISTETMKHGVIASAVNAFNNQCIFTVIYKPRSRQFVVSYDKFVDAMNNNFDIGSRFKMRFEGEDFSEQRCSGTVIRVNNFSPHWKDSEWRTLQVQWDEFASFPRPDTVSPWEIEPFMTSTDTHQSDFLKKKRSRQVNEFEIGESSTSTSVSLKNRNAIEDSKVSFGWPISSSVSTMLKPNNYNDRIVQPMKEKLTNDATTGCMLFGVDIATPLEAKNPIRPNESYQTSEKSKKFQDKRSQHIQTLTSPKEVQSEQFNYIRSRTKVYMHGEVIGRSVDLTVVQGYNELIHELELKFGLKGELQTRNQWEVVFTDNEGDMMLVGDDPWPEFCNMVKKIFICSKEEVKKMNFKNKFSQVGSTILTSSNVKADN